MTKLLKLLAITGLTISPTSIIVACTQKDNKKNDEEIVGETKEINKPNGWITISLELENELRDQEIKLESKSPESILDISDFNQDKKNKKIYTCIVKHNESILPLDGDVKELLVTKINNQQIGDLVAIIIKQHTKVDITDINPLITKEWNKQKGEKAIVDSLINKQLGIEAKNDYEIHYDNAFVDGKFVPGKEITVKAKVDSKLITGIARIKVSDKTDIEYLEIILVEGTKPYSEMPKIILARLRELVSINIQQKDDYDIVDIIQEEINPFRLNVGDKVILSASLESKLLVGKLEVVVVEKPKN